MDKGYLSKESIEDLLNNVPAVLYEYALYDEMDSEFVFLSPAAEQILGCKQEYFLEDMSRFWEKILPEDLENMRKRDTKSPLTDGRFLSEVRYNHPSGEERWIQISSKPGRGIPGGGQIWHGYIIDITERKKAQSEVEVLKGILPICSNCKNIRNSKGYWEQVEDYISRHSETRFSHGMCESCIEKLYGPEMLSKIKNK